MGSSHSHVTDPNAFASKVNENDDRSHWKSYDYVVVGGGVFHESDREPLTNILKGTAGSVLASRLSEDPNVSILLIEAGNRSV